MSGVEKMVSISSRVLHRSSPWKQRSPHMQNRHRSPRSNWRSSRAFYLVVALFILISVEVIFHYPSESFSQIDADLQKILGRQENNDAPKSPARSLKAGDTAKVESSAKAGIEEAARVAKGGNPGDGVGSEVQPDDDDLAEAYNSRSDEGSKDDDDTDMYFRDPKAPVADWHYFPPLKQEPRRDASWEEAGKFDSLFKLMTKEECDKFMQNIDTSPPPLREPSDKACDGYDGVFQIQQFDQGGASGTSFFMFNVGMLAWADQHNYLPWIHIDNNFTKPIWDPIVHTNVAKTRYFTMMEGMEIGWVRDPDDPRGHLFPGKPFIKTPLRPKNFVLDGTGVWEHYFLPVNDFVPGDLSCLDKPIVKMDEDHIVPGMHANAPWAPRAWRYAEPKYVLRWDLTWDQWFKPQRRRGAQMTKRYIRFNPMMERRAHCAFPDPTFSLGMHIRHSDKVVERRVIETDEFLVFAKAFVKHGGQSIYVATDSTKVMDTILEEWPKGVADRVFFQASVEGRSENTTAAFDIGISRHRTNVEALTDVLALSKCTFFLHGLSAISEAVLYLNPGLVSRSINLEDYNKEDERFTPMYFVNHLMPLANRMHE
mmetsp:Transcript_17386/g.43377  ORF Transcript_17386/g.43377 Transcript_17386/m.43377 type:complete len:596 (+) Transcript_17386:86-1873(+)